MLGDTTIHSERVMTWGSSRPIVASSHRQFRPPRPQSGQIRRRYMGAPGNVTVDPTTNEMLRGIAVGDNDVLAEAIGLREQLRTESHLDPKTFSLVKIAALVAMDAAPASYLWQVSEALDAGASPREILGVLTAVAPQTGMPRVIAAAPEIMVALGLELPDGSDL